MKVYRELKCPLDDFELLAWSSGSKGRSYPFCPYCYNNPPFNDMHRGSGCNSCTHPTCQHSLANLGVSSCIECEKGVLVLDCTSSPKNWKLGCNSCDCIINIFDDAVKVTVEEDNCECGAQLMTAVYKQEKTPFPDGITDKKGCVFCSTEFAPLVRQTKIQLIIKIIEHSILLQQIEKHKAVENRRLNSRGGGRGGRGRGRGRGRPKVPKDKMSQLAAYFV